MVHQPFFKGDRYAQSRGTSLFNGPFRMRAHCVLHVTFERWKIFEKARGLPGKFAQKIKKASLFSFYVFIEKKSSSYFFNEWSPFIHILLYTKGIGRCQIWRTGRNTCLAKKKNHKIFLSLLIIYFITKIIINLWIKNFLASIEIFQIFSSLKQFS